MRATLSRVPAVARLYFDWPLVLRPLKEWLCVTERSAGVVAGEPPRYGGAETVRPSGPGASLLLDRAELVDRLGAEAQPRHEAERDLGLVQPLAVHGRAVHDQSCPEARAFDRRDVSGQGLLAVRSEVVEHQMNGHASGHAAVTRRTMRAKAAAVRFGVAHVK